MEKRISQCEHGQPMETNGLFSMCDSGVALSFTTPVSFLAMNSMFKRLERASELGSSQ